MDQVKFAEDSFRKIGSDMVCLDINFTLPQILLGPFLNPLTQFPVIWLSTILLNSLYSILLSQ